MVLVGVSLRVVAAPHSRTVYPIFAESARQWWVGGPMYPPQRPAELTTGFRYSPAFAVLMSPFALLPDALGGVVWRLVMATSLLAALAWWLRTVLPCTLTLTQTGLMFLFAAPLSISSLNNGQANVLVLALLLAGVAAARAQRWNLVAVCLGLSFALKVYPLAIGLLLTLIYPRQLAPRLLVAVGAALAFPFFLQRPEYVAEQYHDWIQCVRLDDRSQVPLEWAYRDAWLLIRRFGLPVSRPVYEILQLVAAALVAALCLAMNWRGWPQRHLLTALLGLGTCWMMLFGPATEACTYVLLGPTLAWAVLESWLRARSRAVRLTLLGSCAFFMSSRIASWFPITTQWHALGVHPLGTILVLLCLLIAQVRGPIEPASEEEPTVSAGVTGPRARAA